MNFRVSLICSTTLALSLACSKSEPPKPSPAATTAAAVKKESDVQVPKGNLFLFKPLSEEFPSTTNPITEEKVRLGRMLYFEKRISKNQDFSCNSCHGLTTYGVDNKKSSEGHKSQFGDRNSPTVYNAAGHFVQFWDGRAADIEEQAKGPVLNPVEMAMKDEKTVLAVLTSIPEYVEAFKQAFPDDQEPVTFDNFAKAVGAFERKLVTPSPWDKFLKGETDALTNEQKAGFNKFVETGCGQCHQGELVGGTMYERLGKVEPWPDLKDVGRAAVTKNDADKFNFKVPSLRNIEKTGPYFHDGSVDSLAEAVKLMAKHQLGKNLSDKDVSSIVAWLSSLTGELPTDYIKEPELPPSTAKTPKADPS